MIYKVCENSDLEKITELVYEQNNMEEHHILYCCKGYENIYKDFEHMINSEGNLVVAAWDKEKICGVLGIYCIDEINRIDSIGPFINYMAKKVEGETQSYFVNLGQNLIAFARNKYTTQDVSFNINAKNTDCLDLMNDLEATLNDVELHLSLEKGSAANVIEESLAIPYKPEYEDKLKKLYDQVAEDYYLTSSKLIETIGSEREVYLILDKDRVISYGVLQFPENTNKEVIIEILGVDKDYRGKGYGRKILCHLINKAFERKNTEKVKLIVDDINNVAKNLYESLGFECIQKSCSYTLRKAL